MEFKRFDSSEGNVFKYVFSGNDFVAESVLYRYNSFAERTVICCSTQSGCPVGCSFCGTGKRFVRNLTSDEIVSQVKTVIEDQNINTQEVRKFQIMFAYVKGRSTIDAVKRHQRNKSRWFLKLDFHDFFGSSKPEFIIAQLETIFPFNEIVARPNGREALVKALSICYLNNGLPQGTPISPTLTNLFMIPIDHYIAKTAREMTPHLVYTRYAEDRKSVV